MRIRTLLLASALPLAVTGLATAGERPIPGTIILAQQDAASSETGAEPCAPDDVKCLRRLQKEQRKQREDAQQAAPDAQAEPAPEAQPEQLQEQAAPEPAPDAQPEQQAAPQPEAPETSVTVETQVAPPPPEEPAAETQAAEPAPAERPKKRRQQAAPEPAPEPMQQQAAPEPAPEPAEQQAAPEPAPQPMQQQAAPAPTAEDNVVEQQLEAQGDKEEADKIRKLRRKLMRTRMQPEDQQQPAPEQQAAPQQTAPQQQAAPQQQSAPQQQAAPQQQSAPQEGQARTFDRRRRDPRTEGEVVERRGDQFIIRLGDQIFIDSRTPDDERLLYGARDVEVQELPGGRTRTIVYRENGSQIITVRNRYGEIETRVRRTRNGRDIVLIDNRYPDVPPPPIYFERELPPLVVEIPHDQYVVETRRADRRQIVAAFNAPPVERVERAYTLQEITRSERLRDKVRRIDLDTITFDFGSATIGRDQMDELAQVGHAIEDVLAEEPDSVFLIEGHTDAVGSDYDNLILSDRRAEAVAVALSQNFNIPPENLITEGYGEQYLKVNTQRPERENRRVTMRNITDLMTASK